MAVRSDMASGLAHKVIHPIGATLRAANPRAYELVRWQLAHSGLVGDLLGRPMYHQLVLPFLVRPGDAVLDVGANIGQYTLPLSRLVGPAGRVHSFEPIPSTFAKLAEAVRRDPHTGNVVLNQMGLAETPGWLTFTLPVDRPTEAAAVLHHSERWVDYETNPSKYVQMTCLVTTVDAYLGERSIDRVAFLKCDVEGAELQILKGAKGLLGGPAPPAIQLEVFKDWTASFGYAPKDLFGFLRAVGGYEIYWFHENGLRRVDPDAGTVPGIFWEWVDFLCLVPGVHNRRIDVARFLA